MQPCSQNDQPIPSVMFRGKGKKLATKIVALANQKGGVGKTTSSLNLAAALALAGKKVLLVDSDPQGNASSGVGVMTAQIEKNIYTCYVEKDDAQDCIVSGKLKNFFLLPASVDMVGAEI